MIKLQGISKYYKTEAGVSVGLYKANLEFETGEFVAIVGESGSGKSTLLNVISGLDSYEEGEMLINGEPTSHYEINDWEKYRKTNVGFVFQNYNIIDSYTVLQNVMLALEFQGYPEDQMKQRALELIEQVGLTDRKNSKAAKLSGGEKQRTVIARALAKDCPIIVCDEPTGNLDSESGTKVLELLHSISKDKLVIVVSHNYEEVAPYATRKIRLHDGNVMEDSKIKPHERGTELVVSEPKDLSFVDILKWSIRDLFTKPKRFIFLLLAFFVVMLLFSLNYASSQSVNETLKNTNVNPFDASQTIDGQVLLSKFDESEFTDTEIENISKRSNVVSVQSNALELLTEASYSINVGTGSERETLTIFGYKTADSTIISKDRSQLKKGSVVENPNQVILSSYFENSVKLGEKIYLTDRTYVSNPAVYQPYEIELTVVGFSKYKDAVIYFHPEFTKEGNPGHIIFVHEVISRTKVSLYGRKNLALSISTDMVLADNEILFDNPEDGSVLGDIVISGKYKTYLTQADGLVVKSPNMNRLSPEVSLDLAKRIAREAASEKYQIVVNFTNDKDARSFAKSLDNSTYAIIIKDISPSPFNEVIYEVVSIFMYIGLAINLLFLYAILGLVTRNTMATRKKDFAIFRSIGANQREIGILVILQQLIISVFSFLLIVVAMIILGKYIPKEYLNLSYFYWYHYIILFVTFMLFALWLGFRFNKRIFKITVIKNLAIEEEV